MKLITFDGGRVGRLELEEGTVIELDVPSTREYFERGGEVGETGERLAYADVKLEAPIRPKKFFHTAGNFADHHNELDGRRLVAPGAQGHRVLPERRRDHRPRRRDRLPRGPHQGARLRARARDHHRQVGQVLRPRRGRRLHRRLHRLQRHHRARHPAQGDGVGRLLLQQGASTRSARSARGSSPPTRCPTCTSCPCSCASTARCASRATPTRRASSSRTWSRTTRRRSTARATSSRPARSRASPRCSRTRSTST